GLGRGVSAVGELLVSSPWFARSSYGRAAVGGALLGPAERPLVNALVVAAAVGALVVVARWHARHQRRGLAVFAAIAAVTVVATVVAIGSSPPSVVGVSAHQMRWAWVTASLAWAALLSAVLVLVGGGVDLRPGTGGRGRRGVRTAAAVVAALSLVAAANLPTHHGRSLGPDLEHAARPALRELMA